MPPRVLPTVETLPANLDPSETVEDRYTTDPSHNRKGLHMPRSRKINLTQNPEIQKQRVASLKRRWLPIGRFEFASDRIKWESSEKFFLVFESERSSAKPGHLPCLKTKRLGLEPQRVPSVRRLIRDPFQPLDERSRTPQSTETGGSHLR